MKRINWIALFSVFLLGTGCNANLGDVLDQTAGVLSSGDNAVISAGLKEALDKGVEEAVQNLARENGYYESIYKILLPEEAEVVTEKLRAIPGFQNIEQNLIKKINEGAELAAQEAGPIFVSAIQQLTIQDAFDILMGEDDAATRFLERTTRQQLYDKFRPVIGNSLDEVGAKKLWSEATTTYNKIPILEDVNPELDDHVANEALDGLFGLIEVKEAEIRQDPTARTTDLLKRVFARQD